MKKRALLYDEKNIFFGTPQTMENDLTQNHINLLKIALIIFDEAHRAVGNFAYLNIVKYSDAE